MKQTMKPISAFAPFRYSFADLFVSPKSALAPRHIGIATLFLITSYTCLVLASYISVLIDGEQLAFAIPAYGLFPPILKAHKSLGATLVWYGGFAAAAICLFQGMLAVALSVIEELRGNQLSSFWGIIRQSFVRVPQLFGALIGIGLLILLFLAVLMLIGLIARIPIVGEWLWSALLLLPNFLVAVGLVGMVYLIGGAALSFLPSIIATDARREIFGPIVEVFSVILRQPMRWLFCVLLAFIFAKLSGFIYAFVTVKGLGILMDTAAITGGRNLPELLRGAMFHLPIHGTISDFFFTLYPDSSFIISLDPLFGRPATDSLSYFCAFMLGLVFATIPGYMLSVISVTLTRAYLLIAYAKDARKIPEEPSSLIKPTAS